MKHPIRSSNITISMIVLFLFLFTGFSIAGEEARLLRFPAVYGDHVVFSYAGDLYTVSSKGGVARKLTNHKGYEMFPRFSPDGKWLAFTGQYDGNTEVYLMEADGGVPKRLTYTAFIGRDDVSDRMGPNNIVMTWKNDGKHIVFRSRMYEQNSFIGRLFETDTDGNMHKQIPLPRGGFCSFSPDDSKMAYNRVFREFRTWKRYRGGMADDIWVHDFKTKKTVQITKDPAQDIIPMWSGNRIFFLSDRGKYERMNLYAYDTGTKKTERLTDFKEYDIKFPSLGKDAIAFENGGYIYLYKTGTNKLEKLTIFIKEDRLHARGGFKKVKKNITGYAMSPDGKRALFGARGDVFTVPVKYGNTRNLTQSAGIHERDSQWSPDGKWIAYTSDKTGENEIFIAKADGKSEPIQITKGETTYKYALRWSPDSKKILWADREQRVRYVDIDKKNIVDVTHCTVNEIREYKWSPDSKWVAYTVPKLNRQSRIYLYSLDSKKNFPVTDQWYTSGDPTFSSCGKFLFFVSNRDYNATFGEAEFRLIFPDMSRIYMVTLQKSTKSPFAPKSDEAAITKAEPKGKKKKDQGKKDKAKPETKPETKPVVKVDADGIFNRVIAIPIKNSRYGSLWHTGKKLYYLRRGTTDSDSLLMMFDMDKRKETKLGSIDSYILSPDGKKMMVAKKRSYAIIDAPAGKLSLDKPLNLSNMEIKWCPKCEWKNIFYDSWRQMRDFFYVKNMHGVDWVKMKKRYEPLLKHVNHRNDLTYIIGEMIGELNVGHAYTSGGERPRLKHIKVGLLGADLERDAKTGFYKITKILDGHNWDKTKISPLTAVGVNANKGDYILAINGKSTAKMKNPYAALNNTAGKQVTLTLNSSPTMKGSRDEVIVPVVSVRQLYYYEWIFDNIRKVNKASNGKIGYLHVPDMSLDGLSTFVKFWLPQLRKKALIVDVRGNGGGFVSELIMERLRREIVMIDQQRGGDPTVNPFETIYGPMVCLADEFSASDGDIFPYRFKKHKRGKLIGKRTWGGVVGIRNPLPLLDGGQLFKPEFASFDLQGKKWIIEGRGVEPDIYVDNDPYKEYTGNDQQLNKAIEVLLQELKTKEKTLPPQPADPDKSLKK